MVSKQVISLVDCRIPTNTLTSIPNTSALSLCLLWKFPDFQLTLTFMQPLFYGPNQKYLCTSPLLS
jgi:hypothetical protein